MQIVRPDVVYRDGAGNIFANPAVDRVAICSVVPSANYAIRSACLKYFRCEPFVLQAGVKTGLKVRYRNPHEVGADRIAGAIAVTQRHPNTNAIVVDWRPDISL